MKKLSNERMSTFSGGSCTLQEYWEWVNNPPWWIWIIPGGIAAWTIIVRQQNCGGTIIFPIGGGGSDTPPGIL